MSRRFVRSLARLGLPLLALGAVLGLAGAATAAPAIRPIQPEQAFIGYVNGQSANAVIDVQCFGPIIYPPVGRPPASGQYVSAFPRLLPSSTSRLGYTGDAGTSIVVAIIPDRPVTSPVSANIPVQLVGTLTTYGSRLLLSSSLTLPCSGTGTVVFAPAPTSPDSRDYQVPVTFEPAPCPPGQFCPLGSES